MKPTQKFNPVTYTEKNKIEFLDWVMQKALEFYASQIEKNENTGLVFAAIVDLENGIIAFGTSEACEWYKEGAKKDEVAKYAHAEDMAYREYKRAIAALGKEIPNGEKLMCVSSLSPCSWPANQFPERAGPPEAPGQSCTELLKAARIRFVHFAGLDKREHGDDAENAIKYYAEQGIQATVCSNEKINKIITRILAIFSRPDIFNGEDHALHRVMFGLKEMGLFDPDSKEFDDKEEFLGHLNDFLKKPSRSIAP